MSIVPLLHLARELEHDYRGGYNDWEHLLDDDFGFGVHPLELFQRPRLMLPHHHGLGRRRHLPYERSHHQVAPLSSQLLSRRSSRGSGQNPLLPAFGKDGFQVCMDVSQFKPNELTVKVLDKTIIVEGRHEERDDGHGLIQRHFVRKYTLPKDYDPNEVLSTVSSDGVLTLKAPPPASQAKGQQERIVQIQQTGPAHLSVKAPEGGGLAASVSAPATPTATTGKNENGGGGESVSMETK